MKTYVLLMLLAVATIQNTTAQTVTTFTDGNPDDAITFDSAGNVYASGFVAGEIFTFTSGGTGSTFITGLDNANGIDFDSADNLYVNDWTGNELLRYLIDGSLDTSITIPGNPSGVLKAIDNDDMIYTRYGANTINRITPDGVITQISDAPELNGPVGLAYDENGNLYVGNYNNRTIYRVGTNGVLTYVATVGGSSSLGFITFGKGRLWGTVLGEHKIYTINHNGVDDVTLFAGSTAGGNDGDLSQATFNQPNGIKFDATETNLYITDFGSKNVRVISGITLSVPSNSVGIQDIKVSPNPGTDTIMISGLSNTPQGTITIFAPDGKLLKELMFEASNGQFWKDIAVAELSTGVYLIQVSDGKNSQTKQWIKK